MHTPMQVWKTRVWVAPAIITIFPLTHRQNLQHKAKNAYFPPGMFMPFLAWVHAWKKNFWCLQSMFTQADGAHIFWLEESLPGGTQTQVRNNTLCNQLSGHTSQYKKDSAFLDLNY